MFFENNEQGNFLELYSLNLGGSNMSYMKVTCVYFESPKFCNNELKCSEDIKQNVSNTNIASTVTVGTYYRHILNEWPLASYLDVLGQNAI